MRKCSVYSIVIMSDTHNLELLGGCCFCHSKDLNSDGIGGS